MLVNMPISVFGTMWCVFFFLFASLINAECPLGWIHYDTSCFLFSSTAISWYDAESSCRAHNARLAEVYSKDIAAYLKNMSMQFGKNYWLGGRDDVVEGTWQWASTNAQFTVTDWAPGEPDDYKTGQDCLYIWKSANYLWDDAACDAKLNYICESEYPGETVIG